MKNLIVITFACLVAVSCNRTTSKQNQYNYQEIKQSDFIYELDSAYNIVNYPYYEAKCIKNNNSYLYQINDTLEIQFERPLRGFFINFLINNNIKYSLNKGNDSFIIYNKDIDIINIIRNYPLEPFGEYKDKPESSLHLIIEYSKNRIAINDNNFTHLFKHSFKWEDSLYIPKKCHYLSDSATYIYYPGFHQFLAKTNLENIYISEFGVIMKKNNLYSWVFINDVDVLNVDYREDEDDVWSLDYHGKLESIYQLDDTKLLIVDINKNIFLVDTKYGITGVLNHDNDLFRKIRYKYINKMDNIFSDPLFIDYLVNLDMSVYLKKFYPKP